MSDSSKIDDALVGLLLADSVLTGLMPDGVFIDEAAQGAQRFVIVSLVEAPDELEFGQRALEQPLYTVEARALASTGANVKAAAARIDALLEQGALTVPGFSVSGLFREERTRATEVDDADPSIRWQRAGGRYRVVASA